MDKGNIFWVALVALVLLFLLSLFISSSYGYQYVRPYYKKNGTYVQPYYRTSPDRNPYNNREYYERKTVPTYQDFYIEPVKTIDPYDTPKRFKLIDD